MDTAEAHAKDKNTCRCTYMQEETAELLFDYEALAQVSFTVFGLVSKDGGILQENMAGFILRYCRLINFPAVQK